MLQIFKYLMALYVAPSKKTLFQTAQATALCGSRHMCSKSQQWKVPVTMSQIMERWPWPKSTNTNMKNECPCETEQVSTSLNKSKQTPASTSTPAAVKLILWPSNDQNGGSNPSSSSQSAQYGGLNTNNTTAVTSSMENKKPSRNKMWSKLPLRQIPSSLSAKMGWLGGKFKDNQYI